MDENELSSGLKIWANVGAELGSKMERIANTNEKLWNKLQFGTPVLRRVSVSGVYPSSGYLTLQLGSPDDGTYWDIESVIIGGTDINVTASGSAGLYVVGMSTNVSPGLGNALDFTTTLPNAAFYGFRDIYVNDGEYVMACIYAGTAGQTYVAAITATVYNVASSLGVTINAGA